MNKILGYILITILLVVILHFLFTAFVKKTEKMTVKAIEVNTLPNDESLSDSSDLFDKLESVNSTNVTESVRTCKRDNLFEEFIGNNGPYSKISHADQKENLSYHSAMGSPDPELSSAFYSYDKEADNKGAVGTADLKCGSRTNYANVDNYIKEYALNGRNVVANGKQDKFSKDDINRYRQNFLNFNENVNKSTNGIDAVDRMNEAILSGNGDCSKNFTGKNISEVFDMVNKHYAHLENPAVIKPEMDAAMVGTHYRKAGHNGATYVGHHLRYETDDVNTGGEFYNGIEGFDPTANPAMGV